MYVWVCTCVRVCVWLHITFCQNRNQNTYTTVSCPTDATLQNYRYCIAVSIVNDQTSSTHYFGQFRHLQLVFTMPLPRNRITIILPHPVPNVRQLLSQELLLWGNRRLSGCFPEDFNRNLFKSSSNPPYPHNINFLWTPLSFISHIEHCSSSRASLSWINQSIVFLDSLSIDGW